MSNSKVTVPTTLAGVSEDMHGFDEPSIIVIFGASGDLTQRKLMPALFNLTCDGLLPEHFAVLGMARSDLDDVSFRERVKKGIETHAIFGERESQAWPAFAKRLYYLQGNYDDAAAYEKLKERLGEIGGELGENPNYLHYLSTPPQTFSDIIHCLGQAGLARQADGSWRRIIVEKPFGHDLASAVKLNRQVLEVFQESQVYRIDHYLGKETVQNLLVFRFANAIFEPLWNRNYIDHVQITVAEEVGLSGRAGFYDSAGVMRDMFQNHLLQLLTLMAMEPPAELEAGSLRDEKVKVLKAVRRIRREEVGKYTVRAQYRIYRDEVGVEPNSTTATYAAVKLAVDNWRWRGVPFYLRSGKALGAKVTEVAIEFRQVPHSMFPGSSEQKFPPNILSLCLQPNEGMHLRYETKKPGAGMRTGSVDMSFHYKRDFGQHALPDAYERLLLDALNGDASLFTRGDEVELAWGIIDSILEGWESEYAPPLVFYESGTSGPVKADEFINADGRQWHYECT
jgi:glucose-6-phosphate 1-dehydrogenase